MTVVLPAEVFADLVRCAAADGIQQLVVGAVVQHDNDVLLLKRPEADFMGGIWELPSGKVENSESLGQSLAREVLEETGLIVVPAGIVEVLDRITQDAETGRVRYHYVLVDFLCRVTGGSLLWASDADEARWVEREQLQEFRLAPLTVAVIEKGFAIT